MRRSSRSTSSRSVAVSVAVAVAVALLLRAGTAAAQACCAGSGAVTPGRLGLHEEALAGVQLKNAVQLGRHDSQGTYVADPSGASEIDLEQDVFGALRLFERGQVGLLIPFVETHRRASGTSELGGGVGDANFSARYDLLLAGESRHVPGIGVLAGITFPTGKTAEAATNTLGTDATGIGAVQGNAGLALEQAFGSWLVGVSGIVSMREPRTVRGTRLGLAPQLTLLGSTGYAFKSGVSAAGVVSYAVEGDATTAGAQAPGSARRVTTMSLASAVPLSDELRVAASLYANPPVSSFGENQPVTVGITVGMIGALL